VGLGGFRRLGRHGMRFLARMPQRRTDPGFERAEVASDFLEGSRSDRIVVVQQLVVEVVDQTPQIAALRGAGDFAGSQACLELDDPLSHQCHGVRGRSKGRARGEEEQRGESEKQCATEQTIVHGWSWAGRVDASIIGVSQLR
jgi:hypothetical protein